MTTAAPSPDLYKTLGVRRNATPAQIAKKYRDKAKACHPDTHPDDPGAAEKFKEIQRAFSVLSDPERRARYDATGDASTNLPDNVGAEAIECLRSVMHSILQRIVASGGNPSHKDIVILMRDSISGSLLDARLSVGNFEKSKAAIQDAASRFEVEPGHVNLLAGLALGPIGAIDEQIASLKKQTACQERALAMLKFYSYNVERPDFSGLGGERQRFNDYLTGNGAAFR